MGPYSNAKQNGPKCIPQSPKQDQYVSFTERNSEQNNPIWPIWEQCVPLKDRKSDQNSPNLPIWEQCVPLKDMGTRNKTVLYGQFGNNVFH